MIAMMKMPRGWRPWVCLLPLYFGWANLSLNADLNNPSTSEESAESQPSATDVAVEVTESFDPVEISQELFYIVTVVNRGTNSAAVVLTNQLPANLSFSSFPAEYLSNSNQVVSPRLELPANRSKTILLGVRPTTLGVLNFTATLMPVDGDTNPANDTVTVTTTVNPTGNAAPPPALRLTDWDHVTLKYNTGEIATETPVWACSPVPWVF